MHIIGKQPHLKKNITEEDVTERRHQRRRHLQGMPDVVTNSPVCILQIEDYMS